MRTAEALRQIVIDELEWRTSLHAMFIGVEVSEGVVTLSGRVQNGDERLQAELAARHVGATSVVNRLRLPKQLSKPPVLSTLKPPATSASARARTVWQQLPV
jgi:hypothetical protein